MNENLFALIRAGLLGGFPMLHDPDWDTLVSLTRRHGLLSALYDAAGRYAQSGGTVPGGLLERLKPLCTLQELHAFGIICEGHRVAGLLRDSGITALFLKGVVLQRYWPRPAMRSMSDIDMLAEKSSFDKVVALLLENGYTLRGKESDGQVGLTGPGGVHVDLHHHLMGERFLDSDKVMGAFTLEPQPFSLEGIEALTLTNEEQLLHIIVHSAKHYLDTGMPLRMLCDLCLFTQAEQDTLDFVRMIELLRPAQLDTVGRVMLSACVAHLGLVPNAQLADVLRGCDEALVERFVNDVVLRGAQPDDDGTELAAAQLAFSFGTGAKQFPLKSYLHAIFPTPTLMKMDYPKLERWPVLYPFYLVNRLWRLLLGKLTGKRSINMNKALKRAREKRRIIEDLGIVK